MARNPPTLRTIDYITVDIETVARALRRMLCVALGYDEGSGGRFPANPVKMDTQRTYKG